MFKQAADEDFVSRVRRISRTIDAYRAVNGLAAGPQSGWNSLAGRFSKTSCVLLLILVFLLGHIFIDLQLSSLLSAKVDDFWQIITRAMQ